jgi:hypothetical protein
MQNESWHCMCKITKDGISGNYLQLAYAQLAFHGLRGRLDLALITGLTFSITMAVSIFPQGLKISSVHHWVDDGI